MILSGTPLWPHQRIVVGLPFDPKDPPQWINPVGETIHHPKPQTPHGHPGIDFEWDHDVVMLAAIDGEVSKIERRQDSPGLWNLDLSSGIYRVGYQEISSVRSDLKVGSNVKKGEVVGKIIAVIRNSPNAPKHSNIHWELDYKIPFYDRLCPMTYFDETSRQVLEKAWADMPDQGDNVKAQFPELCSGDYFGKDE